MSANFNSSGNLQWKIETLKILVSTGAHSSAANLSILIGIEPRIRTKIQTSVAFKIGWAIIQSN